MINAVRKRPALANLVRLATWPADRLWAAMALRGRSWRIERNRGLSKMLGVPLLAWLNYHHRVMIGDQQCEWMGQRALKNPMDAWIYQELLYRIKPDIIIEFGNKNGGSTLFLAGLCELLDHGQVLAVDIDHAQFTASHPRIELITGDCGSESVISQIRAKCERQKVLIIHDADHTRDAVLRDLRNYSGLVSPESYFIVEDTIIGLRGFSGGDDKKVGRYLVPRLNTPTQAIKQFLAENQEFVVDHSCEKYILTDNHGGFLRRVSH